jgi:hypothetical protein
MLLSLLEMLAHCLKGGVDTTTQVSLTPLTPLTTLTRLSI